MKFSKTLFQHTFEASGSSISNHNNSNNNSTNLINRVIWEHLSAVEFLCRLTCGNHTSFLYCCFIMWEPNEQTHTHTRIAHSLPCQFEPSHWMPLKILHFPSTCGLSNNLSFKQSICACEKVLSLVWHYRKFQINSIWINVEIQKFQTK